MKKVSITTILLGVVLLIFTISFFWFANRASYEFKSDFESDLYALTLEAITDQAEVYGQYTNDLFKDNKSVYITVDDLAQKGFVINNDGVVEDPRDNTKKLNDLKIKLTKNKEKVTAKVLA